MDIGAFAESPHALQLQLERLARDFRQLGIDVGRDGLGDLAMEAQGDVQ